MAANMRFLTHIFTLHSGAGTLEFVAEMAEILQALREVTLLLRQKTVLKTAVLPCVKGIFERL